MCMPIKVKNSKKKVRVNITVDKAALNKAKKKLELFGGKLSTLFNAYLSDFVNTMDKMPTQIHEELSQRVKDLEARLKKLEDKS